MKHIQFIFAAMLIMMAGSLEAKAQKGNETITIQTSSVCGMCKTTIEKALAYERGVVRSALDVKTGKVEVTYKSKRTDPGKIRAAINKAGYDADESPADEEAYENLHFCCKKDFKH